tara:strand:- start:6175 stop:6480 length:306 start_codon:yes stop_codon:yes gene_type:complete
MEFTGKLIKILEAEGGTSKSGKAWTKQSCIIETAEEFNNHVCIGAFGDEKIKNLNKLSVGDNVTILCNVYSREYNGKYYNTIDGYWFSKKGEASEDNDLPF